MSNKGSMTIETINYLHKDLETIAALLGEFVYANYYILMETSNAIIHIQY